MKDAKMKKFRLSVFRSNSNIHAQIIDDQESKTLASANSLKLKNGNIENAKQVGKTLAEKAIKQSVKQVVFDRGKFKYQGRIKALADAAREAGLIF